jgi:lipopolysaccharide/colanic/teichoic acid biosynthesis glycosyltransferase
MIQRGAKWVGDRVVAAVLLVLLAPVMLAVAVWILVDTGRPVLLRQERVGKGGRPFRMLKFRTMVQNAPELGLELGLTEDKFGIVQDDPRITRSGRTLRRLNLDELPQLWNVVRGEMSLVGPRPDVVEQVENYEPADRRRLDVLPGITGLAQVEGREEIPWEQRFELDARYVDNWSLWLDLRILVRTVTQLWRSEPTVLEDRLNIERAKAAKSR